MEFFSEAELVMSNKIVRCLLMFCPPPSIQVYSTFFLGKSEVKGIIKKWLDKGSDLLWGELIFLENIDEDTYRKVKRVFL